MAAGSAGIYISQEPIPFGTAGRGVEGLVGKLSAEEQAESIHLWLAGEAAEQEGVLDWLGPIVSGVATGAAAGGWPGAIVGGIAGLAQAAGQPGAGTAKPPTQAPSAAPLGAAGGVTGFTPQIAQLVAQLLPLLTQLVGQLEKARPVGEGIEQRTEEQQTPERAGENDLGTLTDDLENGNASESLGETIEARSEDEAVFEWLAGSQ